MQVLRTFVRATGFYGTVIIYACIFIVIVMGI